MGDSLFSVMPRQEFHSDLEILLSEFWSQYLRKLRPHFLGLTTALIWPRKVFISRLVRTPSLFRSSPANFQPATSFLALPRTLPLVLEVAMLLCWEEIISIMLLLKAVLSAWVQMSARLLLFLLLSRERCLPLLHLPVTPTS